MRKETLFIFLCLLIAGPGYSQTVNGIPLNELNAEYIRVTEKTITLSKKVNIDIEYGQPYKVKNTRVMDKDGNQMQFNSMIEVLNFMSTLGYKLVNCGDSVSAFLMRKKKSQQ